MQCRFTGVPTRGRAEELNRKVWCRFDDALRFAVQAMEGLESSRTMV